MHKRKLWLIIVIAVLLIFCLTLGISIWLSATKLTVTHYSTEQDITESVRIIQLTDLHNRKFGKDNEKLAEKVADEEPDLIFMTGDMINQDDADTDTVCSLVKQLAEIAPVYYGYGNHEKYWEEGSEKELRERLTEAGAIVLNCEYVDVTVNGQELRIGGYYGYYRQPGMVTKDENQKKKELAFADAFEKTDRLKLLLCHIPTVWIDWEYMNKYPVDVVFSGHYHGGQIRLPFIGGIYAPYVGWFPENTKGIFEGGKAVCVLSAGLGNESWIPRINNLPEIVTVDLLPRGN